MARKTNGKSMDAVALLKEDHRLVEELFEKFEKATRKDQKQRIAEQICMELTIHAMIEEEIFYPACRGAVEDDMLDEAHVEHDGAKVLIAEIAQGDPGDPFYEAKVKVLSEEIKHHVKEEERRGEGIFAQAKAADLDLEDLGMRLADRKEELKAIMARSGIPTPETRTMRGHALKHGRPVTFAGS
jgi:hemerythrin superfamily protein